MNLSELIRLSTTQRILLIESLWDSIHADRRKESLSDEEIAAMEEKINAARKTPYDLKHLSKIKPQNLKQK